MPTSAADVLIRAIMTGDSGLPDDVFVNDFAFRLRAGGTPSAAQLDDLFTAVDIFYNTTTSTALSVSDFIGEAVDRAVTHELQAFSISAGGSPIATDAWLGPAAPPTLNSNMPVEVCGVLSFHADLTGVLEETGATRPRARRRGRIYLGPLTSDAVDITADNPLLLPTFLTTMRAAANLMGDSADTDGWDWSVWSRADDELYVITGGWTDNAPDIQRRRGAESTARVTFTR